MSDRKGESEPTVGSLDEAEALFQKHRRTVRADGPLILMYANGQKCLEAHWLNGHPHGIVFAWYDTGQLYREISFENDRENGRYVLWHTNGRLAIFGIYVSGRKVGRWREWAPDGTILRDEDIDFPVKN